MIQRDSLDADSVVVDVGIGEDASFPESVIRKYGCLVYGFDPTPRAIEYVRRLNNERLKLFESGLGPQAGPARFFLPINRAHVSGSVTKEAHLGTTAIDVEMVTLAQVFELLRCDRIDLLKLDIEGGEYDVLPDVLAAHAGMSQILVEFHHNYRTLTIDHTVRAVELLRRHGYRIFHVSPRALEFSFIRV